MTHDITKPAAAELPRPEPPANTISVPAIKLIEIRNLLVREEYQEAYHQLYALADPTFCELEPWEKWEKATGRKDYCEYGRCDNCENTDCLCPHHLRVAAATAPALEPEEWLRPLREEINEIAHNYSATCDDGISNEPDPDNCTRCALEQAYRLAAQSGEVRWIPVSEKLPEYGQEVLLAFLTYNNKTHVLETGHIGDGPEPREKMWYSCSDYYDFDRVTHWQNLPSLPPMPTSALSQQETE